LPCIGGGVVIGGGDATGVLGAAGSRGIGSDLTGSGVNGVVDIDDVGDDCDESP